MTAVSTRTPPDATDPRTWGPRSVELDDRPEARVDITVTEGTGERVEGGLAGTMARRNLVDPPVIVQRGGDPLDLRVRRRHQVEPAEDLVDVAAVGPGG